MKKQWQLLRPNQETVRTLSREMGCTPLVARLMVIRGIGTKAQATRFLNPSLGALTPPLEMAGMNEAVRRIHRALTAGQKILVFGDYDADGITATACWLPFSDTAGQRWVITSPIGLPTAMAWVPISSTSGP
jgi:single-stranded-DNA-specific exonuclease